MSLVSLAASVFLAGDLFSLFSEVVGACGLSAESVL